MSEDISFNVSYKITLSDLNDGLLTYTRANRSRLNLIVGVILLANSLLHFYLFGLNWIAFASLALGLFIILRGYLFVSSMLLFRRYWEIYDTVSDVTIDGEGVHVKSGALDATRAWSGYQSVIESEKAFVFVYAKMGFFTLPKRVLESESMLNELRSMIQAKGPEYCSLIK